MKMKVSLAKQTLNASVADSIEFLRNRYVNDFENCCAIEHYVNIFIIEKYSLRLFIGFTKALIRLIGAYKTELIPNELDVGS